MYDYDLEVLPLQNSQTSTTYQAMKIKPNKDIEFFIFLFTFFYISISPTIVQFSYSLYHNSFELYDT